MECLVTYSQGAESAVNISGPTFKDRRWVHCSKSQVPNSLFAPAGITSFGGIFVFFRIYRTFGSLVVVEEDKLAVYIQYRESRQGCWKAVLYKTHRRDSQYKFRGKDQLGTSYIDCRLGEAVYDIARYLAKLTMKVAQECKIILITLVIVFKLLYQRSLLPPLPDRKSVV